MDFVLIYAEKLTPRLQYITQLLLGDLLCVQHELTDQPDLYQVYHGPRINYSGNTGLNGLHILPAGLMEEEGIHAFEPVVSQFPHFPILFATSAENGFPFDIFSAAFYLISRYEEYLPFSADRHDRFEASESVAFRFNFLHRPLVNEWVFFLSEELLKTWPSLQIKNPSFHFQPSIDIDNAWAYLHKGFFRTIFASLLDLVKGRFISLGHRIKVLRGMEKDPYDNFDWINSTHALYERIPIWFFLSGRYGKYDKNVSLRHSAMKRLVHSCASTGTIGVHPSYGSAMKSYRVKEEARSLSDVVGLRMLKSRQHFLKVRFPDSFRLLLEAGIKEDYSLGYASQPGFRASISIPFRFYDLQAEKITTLIIHPFQVMDRTYSSYLHMEPMEALSSILELAKITKEFGGEFVSIFHNETLSDDPEGKGWRWVYKEMNRRIDEEIK